MIDKIKMILTIILSLIFVFSVLYGIVSVVDSMLEKPILINSAKLDEIIVEENIVKDYSTFYYINDCLDNLVEACKRNQYEDIYKLYLKDYKEQYTKEEIISKLKIFGEEQTEYILNNVYKINDIYLADIDIKNEQIYLLIDIDGTYDFDYCFAFLK